ncbi:beta-mannosidase [Bacteroidia bacterium]|nr:beta-mannosidase [Bacteroidia bacterium]
MPVQLTVDSRWQFRQVGKQEWMAAQVPGCVHTDLLRNGVIEDPYYRTNERDLQWIDKQEWEYRTSLDVTPGQAASKKAEIVFEGLDTYAEVFLNGQKLLEADNMFRTWKVDVTGLLGPGANELRICFRSAITEGLERLARHGYSMPANNDQAVNGGLKEDERVSVFVRKAPYHFGWDWGPRFVTAGIWRPVRVMFAEDSYLEDLYMETVEVGPRKALMTAHVQIVGLSDTRAELCITDRDNGRRLARETVHIARGSNTISLPVEIENPKLWWTNGLGDQHLYTFEASLNCEGKVTGRKNVLTGIRTLRIVEQPDPDGRGTGMYVELNGVPVFMKGANHIPNDMFADRLTREVYRNEIDNAVKANMNMLRVWGGGIYENDDFYEFCDRRGILVWQDFMFACSMYPGDSDFLASVEAEAEDNVRRLRNHPCIALWCGNNEIDNAWQQHNPSGGWKMWKKQSYTPQQRDQMWKACEDIFKEILPRVVGRCDGQRPYRHSSPMAADPTRHANLLAEGDTHFWGVWHGKLPFDAFEQNSSRFVSEYGFQSFPEMATIKKYALPEDHNIQSEVMLSHQRSPIGNDAIREYMGMYYNIPDRFEDFIYVGQVLQAEAIRSAIEIHRGNMPRTMGSLYWQLNDCWPVASWSGTDYYRRWKAMHYFATKANEPVIFSLSERDGKVVVKLVSDKLKEIENVQVRGRIIDFLGRALYSFDKETNIPGNMSTVILELDPATVGEELTDALLVVDAAKDGRRIARGTRYFSKIRDAALPEAEPRLDITRKGNDLVIGIHSDKLIKNLYLYAEDVEGFFSDNYMDVLPGESIAVVFTPAEKTGGEKFRSSLKYKHIRKTMP